MKTKKTFVIGGLFLIALGLLFTALNTYLLLSKITSNDASVYPLLFRSVVLPVAFGVLLWKRLRFIGRGPLLTAFCIAGCLATNHMVMIFQPPLSEILPSLNPVDSLTAEVAIWSKSGVQNEFHFTTLIKLKMVIFTVTNQILGSWTLFAALFFGTLDPRSPRGSSSIGPLSKLMA